MCPYRIVLLWGTGDHELCSCSVNKGYDPDGEKNSPSPVSNVQPYLIKYLNDRKTAKMPTLLVSAIAT